MLPQILSRLLGLPVSLAREDLDLKYLLIFPDVKDLGSNE